MLVTSFALDFFFGLPESCKECLKHCGPTWRTADLLVVVHLILDVIGELGGHLSARHVEPRAVLAVMLFRATDLLHGRDECWCNETAKNEQASR